MDEDGALRLSVKDTGIGISAEDLPKVVEPFGQVESTLSRRYSGTGLGLSLVKTMCELHGGTVALASELGTGTTVTVRFPPERVLDIGGLHRAASISGPTSRHDPGDPPTP